MRNDYKIKPCIKAGVDKHDYLFAFLPTVLWQPWKYRYPGSNVIEIRWLIFYIQIGIWECKRHGSMKNHISFDEWNYYMDSLKNRCRNNRGREN